jgi:hypothetical protein
MAKKSGRSPAFEFEFSAAELKKLLDKEPAKVVFTVSVEAVNKKGGGQVGALRISAKALASNGRSTTRSGNGVDGGPHPPGIPS